MIHQGQRGFGSDNQASIHPEILAEMMKANEGHAPAYGQDPYTDECKSIMRRHFGPDAEIFFVFNGTAANVLSLRALLKSYEAVITAQYSHLTNDECGALEFHGGNKILNVPSEDGKINPEGIAAWLTRMGDQHAAQPRAVSVTQPTEYGTVYSLAELKELRRFTRERGLYLHIDGARYANAAVSLGVDLATMTKAAEPDVLSLGGTKNGFLLGEAVVLFQKQLAEPMKYLQKQEMQLPSKCRFLAAQFKAYLQDDLWKRIAQKSLGLAQELASGLRDIPEMPITQPVQSNAVFPRIPKDWTRSLKEVAHFYIWDETEWIARLMLSHDSEIEDVQRFIATAKKLSRGSHA